MTPVDERARLDALYSYHVLDVEPEAPFDRITSVVKSMLNVPIAAVSLVDSDRQWFLSRQGLDASETPRNISFCTHTITGNEAMVVPNALDDPRFRDSPLVQGPPFIRSYAGVPLQTPDGFNIGALCVKDVVVREFDPAQIAVLASFATLVMGELELRRVAQSDPLTGALTRGAFATEAKRAMARYTRHQRPSALLLLDIDHFKSVNDGHGHPAGDAVLKTIARRCTELLREGDVLGRVGGEEFAILLAESDAKDAIAAAERFRRAIAELSPLPALPLRITASFGITPLWQDCATVDEWLATADRGLYAAKRGGRNRCELAAGDTNVSVAA